MSGKQRGEFASWSIVRTKSAPPPLELAFGSSCKPFALLTCQDVHPCFGCAGEGYGGDEACGDCNGTGIGEIPWGSAICCSVCHKSGKDSYRWLQRDPATDPPPEPEPTKMPEEDEQETPLTRKQKRAKQYGS